MRNYSCCRCILEFLQLLSKAIGAFFTQWQVNSREQLLGLLSETFGVGTHSLLVISASAVLSGLSTLSLQNPPQSLTEVHISFTRINASTRTKTMSRKLRSRLRPLLLARSMMCISLPSCACSRHSIVAQEVSPSVLSHVGSHEFCSTALSLVFSFCHLEKKSMLTIASCLVGFFLENYSGCFYKPFFLKYLKNKMK